VENVIQLIDGNYLKMTKLNILIVITLILIMPVSHAKEINISDLPLDEKIHQMIIIPAENYYDKDVGGIFFGTGKKLDSSKEYEREIKILQDKSKIKIGILLINFIPAKHLETLQMNLKPTFLEKNMEEFWNQWALT